MFTIFPIVKTTVGTSLCLMMQTRGITRMSQNSLAFHGLITKVEWQKYWSLNCMRLLMLTGGSVVGGWVCGCGCECVWARSARQRDAPDAGGSLTGFSGLDSRSTHGGGFGGGSIGFHGTPHLKGCLRKYYGAHLLPRYTLELIPPRLMRITMHAATLQPLRPEAESRFSAGLAIGLE